MDSHEHTAGAHGRGARLTLQTAQPKHPVRPTCSAMSAASDPKHHIMTERLHAHAMRSAPSTHASGPRRVACADGQLRTQSSRHSLTQLTSARNAAQLWYATQFVYASSINLHSSVGSRLVHLAHRPRQQLTANTGRRARRRCHQFSPGVSKWFSLLSGISSQTCPTATHGPYLSPPPRSAYARGGTTGATPRKSISSSARRAHGNHTAALSQSLPTKHACWRSRVSLAEHTAHAADHRTDMTTDFLHSCVSQVSAPHQAAAAHGSATHSFTHSTQLLSTGARRKHARAH